MITSLKRPFSYLPYRSRFYSDLHLHLQLYSLSPHRLTFIHLKNKDPDLAFVQAFKTCPADNTGVAHILQHLITCGSHKYPVKDPFMKMLDRSVNTYMNAWTSNEFTAFPFSSPNIKDFKNLLDIYLDLNNPLLRHQDFLQQGWRVEQGAQGFQYNGVVLNEMIGYLQSPSGYFSMKSYEKLLNSKGHNYGGQPQSIIKLSFENLKAFHKKFYRPSNSLFLLYGQVQPQSIIQAVQNKFRHQPQTPVPELQLGRPVPGISVFDGPQGQHIIKFVFFSSENTQKLSGRQIVMLEILELVLGEYKQSVFYKWSVGEGRAESCSLFSEVSSYLQLNLQIKSEKGFKFDKINQEFRSLIDKLKSSGIERQIFQCGLNQYRSRLLLRKVNQGINLFQDMIPLAMHNKLQDVLEAWDQLSSLTLDQLNHFCKSWFDFENMHVCYQKPQGVKSFQLDLENSPAVKDLANQHSGILQEQHPVKDCLPQLSFRDISIDQPSVRTQTQGQIKIVECQGKMTTLRIIFKFNEVPGYLSNYMGFFEKLFQFGLGTKKRSANEFNTQIRKVALPLQLDIQSFQTPSGSQRMAVFKISFQHSNLPRVLQLLRQLLFQGDIGQSHNIADFLSVSKNKFLESIYDEPIELGIRYRAAETNQSWRMRNLLQQGVFLSNIQKHSQGNLKMYLQALKFLFQGFRGFLFKRKKMTILCHCDFSHFSDSRTRLRLWTDSLQAPYLDGQNFGVLQNQPQALPKRIILNHVYQQNYCVRVYKINQFSYQKLHLYKLFALLLQQPLHRFIREKGGAYGSGALSRNNVLATYSYLDPHDQATFARFQQAVRIQLSGGFTVDHLNNIKIKLMGIYTKPILPQDQLFEQLVLNYPQSHRRRIFNQLQSLDKQTILRQCRLGEWSDLIMGGKQLKIKNWQNKKLMHILQKKE